MTAAAIEDRPGESDMPAGPRFSRAANDPVTHEDFERAMGMLLDRVDDLRGNHAAATAEAIAKVATDPEVIRQVLDRVAEAAQERATRAAGQGVWWLVKNVLSKWVVIGVIVVMAAKVLGWDIAAKIGKWLGSA